MRFHLARSQILRVFFSGLEKIHPEHGRDASLLANIAEALLDNLGHKYESFTPVTMSLPEVSSIEPDYFFYIENWRAVVGKKRIDWQNGPPPDLAIEVDVTSYTDINDYLLYKVAEVWLLRNRHLFIYKLQSKTYVLGESSYFSNVSGIVQVRRDRRAITRLRRLGFHVKIPTTTWRISSK